MSQSPSGSPQRAIWLRCTMLGLLLAIPNGVNAALAVHGEQPIADVNITGNASATRTVDFSSMSNVSALGLIADWTAVVADNEDGLYPWALDLRITATSPLGDSLIWDPIGGDVTIADYPLADFSPSFAAPQPGGRFDLVLSTPGVPNPFTSGIRSATIYALQHVPNVVTEYDGSVATGPTWNRPFFIDGVSGLGPVVYDVIEFTVPQSGGFSFLSQLPSGNNFNFLYRGSFDPLLPLEDLLDYGLGNGNAQNGTPVGTSRIDALLLEGESYFYVTSQFDRFSAGQPFETTITGPAAISIVGHNASGDFNVDGNFDCTDVDGLVAAIVAGSDPVAFDMTGDGVVNQADLTKWLTTAGFANLGVGRAYLPGDATLDGAVDLSDFHRWNASRGSSDTGWCVGDFNADGSITIDDFDVWNAFRFQTSNDAVVVPEMLPTHACLAMLLFLSITRIRRLDQRVVIPLPWELPGA